MLNFSDIEELLAARDITVSYETIIRNLCLKFGNRYCSNIKKSRGQLSDTCFFDEGFIKVNGVLHYLWRTVDHQCHDLSRDTENQQTFTNRPKLE